MSSVGARVAGGGLAAAALLADGHGGRRWWSDEAGHTRLGQRGSVARGEPILRASSGGGGPEGRVRRGGARRRQWQPWELGCACRQELGWPFIGARGRTREGRWS
jgi:hypothetical protein